MGYYEYMIRQLQPLRLYALETGVGAEDLRAVGAMLDAIEAAMEHTEKESCVLSAEDEGLAAVERLLPYVPAYTDLAARRAALAALLRIDGRSFTLSALRDTLSGCGVTAVVDEGEEHYVVTVRFPDTMGEPENFEQLRPRIEAILPCHLEIRYLLRWLLWQELERIPSWAVLEAQVDSFAALEKLRMD